MSKGLKITLLILNVAAFVASISWLVYAPDFEPLISSIVTFLALVGFIIYDQKKNKPKRINKQVVNNKGKVKKQINITENKGNIEM
jgi:membrane protein implicated in regulation of membrane protease activity